MDPFSLPEIDATLHIDTLDSGVYGNNFAGQFDADGNSAFLFEADGGALLLEFDAYDIDYNGEVGVFLNGELVGLVDKGVQNGLSGDSLVLDADVVLDGQNVLEFQSANVPPPNWGVTNILLSESQELLIDI